MRLFRWLIAILLFPVLAFLPPLSWSQDAPPQQSPNIRVSVDRVNVGVIVTDSHGQFVPSLGRQDFRAFDNGVEQPITDLLNVDELAQVLVLIEAGPAVYLMQGGHLRAVYALLNGLSAGDRVAVASYDASPRVILDFTSDKNAAAGVLDQLSFNLGVGQLNLSSSIVSALDWLDRVPGKKSLVLLSTGLDTSPPVVWENLLARLKTTDVRVLAVSLGAELRSAEPADKKHGKKYQGPSDNSRAVSEGLAHADEQLRKLTAAAGGRVYFPANAKDFESVYAQIAQLLRHEYNLAFMPPVRDGKVHSIEVRVALPPNPNVGGVAPATYRVDHGQAYLASAP